MIDRRSLIALGLATPLAGRSFRLDYPDPRLDSLHTQGVTVFGISPDARVLVGTMDGDRLAFLNISTHAVVSETEAMDALPLIDELSVAWSPDGSRFAFSLRGWTLSRDSDIFVVDIATGEVTNITPEESGVVAESLMEADTPRVDISPVWLDDDTLLFARHTTFSRDELGCEITKVTISDGTTETFVDLAPEGILWVTSNIWQLSGGELVLAVDYGGGEVPRGIIKISPEGKISDIHRGALNPFMLESVNDTHLIAIEVAEYAWWYVPLDNSEELIPLWEKFPPPEGWSQRSAPVLGPEPNTMFVVLKTTEDVDSAYLFKDGKHRQLAQLTGEGQSLTPHWASKMILVAGNPDSWLVPLDGVGS